MIQPIFRSSILFTISALGLIACKAVDTTTPQASPLPSATSINYVLPEVAFEIKAVYQLRECNRENVKKVVDGVESFETETSFTVKAGFEVSPTVTTLSTPSFQFQPDLVADGDSSESHKLTVNLYPNSTIKSLNATGEDKTGSIIGNLFKFATNLLGVAFGLGADPNLDANSIPDPVCHESVTSNLKSADDIVARIGVLKSAIITQLTENEPSEELQKIIVAHETAISTLEEQLSDIRTNKLTIKKTYNIPARELNQNHFLALSKLELAKWLKAPELAKWGVGAQPDRISKRVEDLWAANSATWGATPKQPLLGASLKFSHDGSYVEVEASHAETHDEIVVRQPVITDYALCQHSCEAQNNGSNTKRYAEGLIAIPQWGEVSSIDFDLEVFEKRTVAIEFDQYGATKNVTLDVPSRADTVISALAGASEQAVPFIEAARMGREKAELNELTLETDLLKKRVEFEEAQDKFDEQFATDPVAPDSGVIE